MGRPPSAPLFLPIAGSGGPLGEIARGSGRRSPHAASCNSSGSGGGGDNGGNNDSGPGGSGELTTDSLNGLDLDDDGIFDLDDTVDSRFTDVFAKYTAIVLPKGRIHLLTEANVSDEKFLRVRSVLEHHVTRNDRG